MNQSKGFSLIELAIAIFVITLLLGGLLVPLSSQVEQRQISDTRKYLEEIKEALIGFAVTNGRLPCPASSASAGVENPSGGGACTNSYDGFVPAVTLGLAVVDNQGFAVDPWGNRVHYGKRHEYYGPLRSYAKSTHLLHCNRHQRVKLRRRERADQRCAGGHLLHR